MQPRLLLVPHITALEWLIRPELEEWAEVATFDVPGVGDEPPVKPLDRQAIVDRALIASMGFGYAISRGPVLRRFAAFAPALGALSLAFGGWYALGALEVVPYYY